MVTSYHLPKKRDALQSTQISFLRAPNFPVSHKSTINMNKVCPWISWSSKSGWLSMAYKGMDNNTTLTNFKGAFYRFYAIRPWSASPKCGEDSLKSTSFSLLTPHIPHNDSGSEQIDPLLTLYKRIKSH